MPVRQTFIVLLSLLRTGQWSAVYGVKSYVSVDLSRYVKYKILLAFDSSVDTCAQGIRHYLKVFSP